jgi:putative tryptophan/tyrosine transport system substrate-binding protein
MNGSKQAGMGKNTIIGLLVGLVLTSIRFAEGQQAKKVPQVGMLMPVSSTVAARNIEAFRQGLRERGYVDGQNIALDSRFADGRVEPLPTLAAELVRLNVDVIVTWGTPAIQAAKKATTTIPIVMAAATDPVETGLIASLARPGGNVTGVNSGGVEVSGKILELLKELVPRGTRVGILWNPDNRANEITVAHTKVAAQALGLRLQFQEVRDPGGFDSAFAAMTRQRADALRVLHEILYLQHGKRLVDLAAKNRLPAIYARREYVEAGGLMAYGVNFQDNFRRAATYVDKILKGTSPAELPVEQPMKFEFFINLQAAKRIGLVIPGSVLFRADRVIPTQQ